METAQSTQEVDESLAIADLMRMKAALEAESAHSVQEKQAELERLQLAGEEEDQEDPIGTKVPGGSQTPSQEKTQSGEDTEQKTPNPAHTDDRLPTPSRSSSGEKSPVPR